MNCSIHIGNWTATKSQIKWCIHFWSISNFPLNGVHIRWMHFPLFVFSNGLSLQIFISLHRYPFAILKLGISIIVFEAISHSLYFNFLFRGIHRPYFSILVHSYLCVFFLGSLHVLYECCLINLHISVLHIIQQQQMKK